MPAVRNIISGSFLFMYKKNKHYSGSENSVEVHVNSMARNYFKNFPVEFIHFCNGAEAKQLHSAYKDYVESNTLVIAETDTYYLIEGDLTLFSPALTLVTRTAEPLNR